MAQELADRRDRVEPLLAAAERLYAERGFEPVPLAALAEDVGLPEQQVYNYVGTEAELYVACHRRARAQLRRQLDEITAEPIDHAEQVERCLVAIFCFVEAQRAGWEALAERAPEGFGPARAELADSRRETVRLLAQLLAEGRASVGGDPGAVNTETTASALIGAIGAVSAWWNEHPEVPASEVAEAMKRVLWGGLPAWLES